MSYLQSGDSMDDFTLLPRILELPVCTAQPHKAVAEVSNIGNLWERLVAVSHAAQGGGGSFKYRKPTGEVGCCESWLARQIH